MNQPVTVIFTFFRHKGGMLVTPPIQTVWQNTRTRFAMYPRLSAFVILLLWSLIVRLPFAQVLGDDEAFFNVVATRWLHGELPYVDSYDIKAPGIFAIFALTQTIFGSGLLQIKGMEVVFVGWGAYGLYRMLYGQGLSRMAHWVSVLYPVYSLFQQGVSFPTQLFQMALTIEAFRYMLDGGAAPDAAIRLRHMALSGLMIGCAVMVKQTAAFEGLSLFGWLVLQTWRRKAFLPLAIFCVAGALPTLVFGAYFVATGHFIVAFNDVVMSAFQRSQLDMWIAPDTLRLGPFRRLTNFPALIKPLLVITCGALLALLRLPRIRAALSPALLVLTLLWYVAATASILILNSPALYCGFPLLAPTLILCFAVLCHGIDFKPRQRGLYMGLFALAAVIQPVIMEKDDLFLSDYNGIPDYKANMLAAESLKAQGVRPGDNLLVLSRGHYAYVFTGALPRTKYFNAMHLLCPFPTPDANPLAVAMDSRPQYILLSDSGIMIGCLDVKRIPYLSDRLDQDYTPVSNVKGVWDNFTIYKRLPGH
jgi:hypothetical protein